MAVERGLDVRTVFLLSLPFAGLAFYFFFVSLFLPPGLLGKYGSLLAIYFLPPAGKESVIPLMLSANSFGPPLPAWAAVTGIIAMDVVCSVIISYCWWFPELLIKGVPFLDKGYGLLQRKASKYRGKGIVELPLLLFMVIPFQGTGGISTSIIARTVGVGPGKTVLICFLGSMITTVVWTMWWTGILSFLG